jgi:hypothetical protein
MTVKRTAQRDGRVALRHPDARACSVEGCVFVADEDGVFRVPSEAAAVLAAHGFTPIPHSTARDTE